MAIPDYQQFMLPFMKLASDGQEHSIREAYHGLPEQLGVSEEEKKEMLPSGLQLVVNNRIGWARTYLKKAGLIEQPKRGFFKITERGRKAMAGNPQKINNAFLSRYPEFEEFRTKKNKEQEGEESLIATEQKNPEELLEIAYEELNRGLGEEILDLVKNASPEFFERLVIDLLLKMGYGGSRKDAGKAIGRRGDEGIDGYINEDRLGLDVIYVQAKRWQGSVGRPEIHKFVGALAGQRAKKGIYITTSIFTKDARDYVSGIESKVSLIDGEMLTKLMIEHNVGVSTSTTYEVKQIDSDYFEEA